eukprot:4363847-Amphidinium_carterae.1
MSTRSADTIVELIHLDLPAQGALSVLLRPSLCGVRVYSAGGTLLGNLRKWHKDSNTQADCSTTFRTRTVLRP